MAKQELTEKLKTILDIDPTGYKYEFIISKLVEKCESYERRLEETWELVKQEQDEHHEFRVMANEKLSRYRRFIRQLDNAFNEIALSGQDQSPNKI